ncbi:MAG TPA: c-type cytochrome [Polyangia bacterium]|nr:c-type cytochrome [Polyangia bacterium]
MNRIFWALSIAATVAAGCARTEESAAEGAATVGTERGPNRSVVNQPLGPIPGPGDLAPVANPLGDDPEARVQGRELFVRYNCAGCHGGRAGGGMGPSLRDPSWRYGSTPDRVFNSIAQGRGQGMPAWGARLDEKQIWELAAYVASLRTPDEPEAPR